ncbi:MAG: hypothetical protein LBN21_08310 [Treponema sp.]|jgi:hypothetical protein|nr:hypothetical protein [Treponema sp.]
MYSCPPSVSQSIPSEYRKIAEELFPSGSGAEEVPNFNAVSGFAEVLGIGADYRRLLDLGRKDKEMHVFLCHFQNNLDLLIQKTWVEKDDETRKEKLQDQIPGFVAGIEQGNFQQALVEFAAILEELAYLMFGAQSTKDDFTEYTFRIDSQMGLFWWYEGHLAMNAGTSAPKDPQTLWAALLIGICFLTNF